MTTLRDEEPASRRDRVWRISMAALTALVLIVRPFAIAAARRRERLKRPLRSLWAGTPILTLPIKARAEHLLGVDARTLVYETYFITDAFDYNLQRWMRPRYLRAIRPLVRFGTFLWACTTFDRLHFFCGQGLLSPHPHRSREFNPVELRLYRSLGKEVFFWTYGADVRTQQRTMALGPVNCCTLCPEPGRYCICDERAGDRNYGTIQAAQTGATAVFSMGDMIHYTPGSINNVYFWPVDLGAEGGCRYEPRYPNPEGNGPLRVAHAPNHRAFKGTDLLLAAVDRLRQQGVEIELLLVEGVPNREALDLYRQADLVFDQCLIGFHGYLAQEAMALGKPVVCFIRHPQQYLLAPKECPIINIQPESSGTGPIERLLRELADDRQRLHELGVRGRRYIERHHTPERFAARLEAAYRRLGVRSSCDA